MALPTFEAEWFEEKSNEELGGMLLAWEIAEQADNNGIPIDQISKEFKNQVRQFVLTREAVTAKCAPLEKALHKAASGDFETAGRLLREDISKHSVLNNAA